MMKMGTCCLCGNYRQLNEEHVPPKNAFNKETIIQYSLEDRIKKQKPKGRKIQGGIRGFTLCETCNKKTGNLYGKEFTDWAKLFHNIIPSWDKFWIEGSSITLHNVYPLRFLKQVVTCFFSEQGKYGLGFLQNNATLAQFVLEKDNTHLPSGFRYFVNLYRRSPITPLRRYFMAVKIPVKWNTGTGGISAQGAYAFSEILHPPFQLLMTQENLDYSDATEITYFGNYGYDQQVTDFPLKLRVIGSSSPYPGAEY